MDFVVVMLFTQQVSHLQCFFYSVWYVRLVKSQSGVAYKSVAYKKGF